MSWWVPKEVSARARIQLGTMNFGKRTPASDSERIIHGAIERGIDFFDTANVYCDGESERILGRALKGKRGACTIATKVGFARIDGKAEGLGRARLLAACYASLSRLGIDCIDLYYLHVPDHATPIEESLDALSELLDKKKISRWGVSNYASWQILEMMHIADARKMPRPVMSQQIYNVLIRQLEVEYFKFTRKFPIVTTVYNPLAGGLLTGKHACGASQKGSRFENNRLYQTRYWSEAMFDRTEELGAIARDEGLALTDLAYAWLAGRPEVDAILVGPGTMEHLDSALAACDQVLSPAVRQRIDDAYRNWQGTDVTYAR